MKVEQFIARYETSQLDRDVLRIARKINKLKSEFFSTRNILKISAVPKVRGTEALDLLEEAGVIAKADYPQSKYPRLGRPRSQLYKVL